MKRIIAGAVITAVLLSCNNTTDKGKFTVSGELKNAMAGHVYLEEISFVQKAPEVLDSAEIKNGKFVLSAIAPEEGLYHIRTEQGGEGYLFVNDNNNISFTGDAMKPGFANSVFNGAANSSLKNLVAYADSLQKMIGARYNSIMDLKKRNVSTSDSLYVELNTEFSNLKETLTIYCFKYADTAKSPVVAAFAATIAPVEIDKFELPLSGLAKRFPAHKGIASVLAFVKEQVALQKTPPPTPGNLTIGSVAPDITMNDVNGKPFSLSQLRGKYVLVDFWASWCAPCRGENPNIVAAYNQFKDKNFTILGVSLDEDKAEWLKAIAQDKLSWQQISDLKGWGSAAVPLYGIDGIPFNVLLDPEGKIIAGNLRGSGLESMLNKVLK